MSRCPPIYRYRGAYPLAVLSDKPQWLQDAILEATATGEWEDAMESNDCKITEAYGVTNETLTVWRHGDEEWFVEYHDFNQPIIAFYIVGELDFWQFQVTQLYPMSQKIMAADVYHKKIRVQAGMEPAELDEEPDEDATEEAESEVDESASKLTRPSRLN